MVAKQSTKLTKDQNIHQKNKGSQNRVSLDGINLTENSLIQKRPIHIIRENPGMNENRITLDLTIRLVGIVR